MYLRCKDTLFFRNFQEINKKVFVGGGGRGREKQKSATPSMGIALYLNISMFLGDYHLGSTTPSFLTLSLPIVKSPLAASLYSGLASLPASSANMFDLPSTSDTLSLAQLEYTLFWNVGTPVFDWLEHTAPVFETMLFVQLIALPTLRT